MHLTNENTSPSSGVETTTPDAPDNQNNDSSAGQTKVDNLAPNLSDPEMLAAIAAFLRRYLVCDDHQLTVLALWTILTWCYEHFTTTAYLEIRSPETQSGKSRCLELLDHLSLESLNISGSDPRTVLYRLLTEDRLPAEEDDFTDDEELQDDEEDEAAESEPTPKPWSAVLLDDCHHIFGSSERQPIIAALNSGARQSWPYVVGDLEYYLFGPKAFAGNGRLPRSLASRCIPIVLQRKKPSDAVIRPDVMNLWKEYVPLRGMVIRWREQNGDALQQLAVEAPRDLPANLTPAQQASAEPLVHIADVVGGDWPQKARAAIRAVFEFSGSSEAVQLLSDIRDIFLSIENPEYLTTEDLLSVLTNLDDRPWASWSSKSGKKIGGRLSPFGISSDDVRVDPKTVLKGYWLKDFQDAWERYLPPISARCATKTASATDSATTIS